MSALSISATLPIATLAPSIAETSPSSLAAGDQEIIRLAARVFDLLPAYRAASEASNAAYDELERRRPSYPDELFWRIHDPVPRSEIEVERNGKTYLICNLGDIELLKEKPPMLWERVGDERSTSSDFDRMGYPRPACSHLWRGRPDAKRQARANELIAAADLWNRQYDELVAELNCDGLLAKFEELGAEIDMLVQQLESLRAYTLPALRAKAAVFAQHLFDWDHDSQIDECSGFQMIRSIIDDLGGQYPLANV